MEWTSSEFLLPGKQIRHILALFTPELKDFIRIDKTKDKTVEDQIKEKEEQLKLKLLWWMEIKEPG